MTILLNLLVLLICDLLVIRSNSSPSPLPIIENLAASALTANGYYLSAIACAPQQARYSVADPIYAWCPPVAVPRPNVDWLQIDLGKVYVIRSIGTKGRDTQNWGNQWVTKYKLSYKIDGTTPWIEYDEFDGNEDETTEVIHDLTSILVARYVRFYPLEANTVGIKAFGSMKVEIYGYVYEDTICHTPDELNILFLLDESGSIEVDNFNTYIIPFTQQVIQKNINPTSKISILSYDLDVENVYLFQNTQIPRATIINKLSTTTYDDGDGTNPFVGLEAAITEFQQSGLENNNNNIIFLVTDGGKTDASFPEPCTLKDELLDNKIVLVAIAVNVGINSVGLDCADFKYEVESFNEADFQAITKTVGELTCTECQYWSTSTNIDESSNFGLLSFTHNNNNNIIINIAVILFICCCIVYLYNNLCIGCCTKKNNYYHVDDDEIKDP